MAAAGEAHQREPTTTTTTCCDWSLLSGGKVVVVVVVGAADGRRDDFKVGTKMTHSDRHSGDFQAARHERIQPEQQEFESSQFRTSLSARYLPSSWPLIIKRAKKKPNSPQTYHLIVCQQPIATNNPLFVCLPACLLACVTYCKFK